MRMAGKVEDGERHVGAGDMENEEERVGRTVGCQEGEVRKGVTALRVTDADEAEQRG